MTTVAVIGGIGCGKSSVTALLAARGAVVVDADVVAREVTAPGAPALGRLAEAFGADVLAADGSLDREALAKAAFSSPSATARMNEILHPAIGVELVRQVDAARSRHGVVVVAIPLYRPEHRDALKLDRVVAVDCPPELALERLVARGMTAEDATLRMAAQAQRAERLALADEVIDNSGTEADLRDAVAALWQRLAP